MSGSRQIIVSSRMCPVANTVFRNRVTVNLPTPIECPKSCDMYASVVDAQIPNTYNTVDDRNSASDVDEHNNSSHVKSGDATV